MIDFLDKYVKDCYISINDKWEEYMQEDEQGNIDFIGNSWNTKLRYEEIINSINEWENTLLTKTNQIKAHLKDEISLLEKIVYNFNQYFLNYTYYSTFYSLEDYIKNKKYDLLIKFKNNNNFKEKNDILFEYFDSNKKEPKNESKSKIGDLKHYYSIGNGLIEKINRNFYFEFYNKEKMYLSSYNKEKDMIYYSDILFLGENIYSVSVSKNSNQIYICLLDRKIVKIIDYNLDAKKLEINKNEIIDNNNLSSHFNKCIQITKVLFATADDNMIIIWNKTKGYKQLKTNNMHTKTSNLLLFNNKYFISSQPNNNTINIINIKNFNSEKKYLILIVLILQIVFYYFMNI